MSVLRTEDGEELILTCRCGCDDGIYFKIDKDFDDYMYMTYANGNFFRDQDDTFIRNFIRKLHKILAIIFNKDYIYAEAIFSKEDFEAFREYINSFAVHKENSTDVLDNQ